MTSLGNARAIVGAGAAQCGPCRERPNFEFPIIVRPLGSHAGVGLAKMDDRAAIGRSLLARPEPEFFVSRFVDYAGDDGLFRKYRIVIVDGRPYACHMAIADRWDIWYLNAGMAFSESKRVEEENFMRSFDQAFAARHRLRACRHDRTHRSGLFHGRLRRKPGGELLIFEADNTAVVHNINSPELFPYKAPQMRKVFEAFATMLYRRAQGGREHAA